MYKQQPADQTSRDCRRRTRPANSQNSRMSAKMLITSSRPAAAVVSGWLLACRHFGNDQFVVCHSSRQAWHAISDLQHWLKTGRYIGPKHHNFNNSQHNSKALKNTDTSLWSNCDSLMLPQYKGRNAKTAVPVFCNRTNRKYKLSSHYFQIICVSEERQTFFVTTLIHIFSHQWHKPRQMQQANVSLITPCWCLVRHDCGVIASTPSTASRIDPTVDDKSSRWTLSWCAEVVSSVFTVCAAELSSAFIVCAACRMSDKSTASSMSAFGCRPDVWSVRLQRGQALHLGSYVCKDDN